jgi:SulP family sulfate permease
MRHTAANQSRLGFAHALRASLREGYNGGTFYKDLVAATVVSLVALPLSMALAIAVGLPPQHGIYTAVIAGIVAALLGGSKYQVSGPTAAFVVILVPIVQEFGLRGLIIAEIMAGVMLIAMALARFGKLVSYVPYPVTTGFTSGIAVVIGTLALNDMLGLHIEKLEGHYIDKVIQITSRLPHIDIYNAAIGIATLLTLAFWNRIAPKIPAAVVAISLGTALGLFLSTQGHDISTIGSQFSYTTHSGDVVQGIPPYPPLLHAPNFIAGDLFAVPSFDEIQKLFMPALVIAVLAALESLLSATVADGLAGTRHNPNAELFGIGAANILSGLAAGIPATGAIARTATNIRAGAKTPIAAVLHAVLIMVYVLLLAPYISYVPMASLAALLFITAYHMSHYKQFITVIKIAPKHDVAVLLACFALTVFVDMVAGVTVGIVLASFLFMKRMADLTETSVETGKDKHIATTETVPDNVLIYHIAGPLFFGTAEKALDRAEFAHPQFNYLILDITQVPTIDLTGLVALESIIQRADRYKNSVILCALPQLADKIMRKLPKRLSSTLIVTPNVAAAIKKTKENQGNK